MALAQWWDSQSAPNHWHRPETSKKRSQYTTLTRRWYRLPQSQEFINSTLTLEKSKLLTISAICLSPNTPIIVSGRAAILKLWSLLGGVYNCMKWSADVYLQQELGDLCCHKDCYSWSWRRGGRGYPTDVDWHNLLYAIRRSGVNMQYGKDPDLWARWEGGIGRCLNVYFDFLAYGAAGSTSISIRYRIRVF